MLAKLLMLAVSINPQIVPDLGSGKSESAAGYLVCLSTINLPSKTRSLFTMCMHKLTVLLACPAQASVNGTCTCSSNRPVLCILGRQAYLSLLTELTANCGCMMTVILRMVHTCNERSSWDRTLFEMQGEILMLIFYMLLDKQ